MDRGTSPAMTGWSVRRARRLPQGLVALLHLLRIHVHLAAHLPEPLAPLRYARFAGAVGAGVDLGGRFDQLNRAGLVELGGVVAHVLRALRWCHAVACPRHPAHSLLWSLLRNGSREQVPR